MTESVGGTKSLECVFHQLHSSEALQCLASVVALQLVRLGHERCGAHTLPLPSLDCPFGTHRVNVAGLISTTNRFVSPTTSPSSCIGSGRRVATSTRFPLQIRTRESLPSTFLSRRIATRIQLNSDPALTTA